LGIWNENWTRNKIWEKQPVWHVDFFPKLDKKSQVRGFGTDLERTWPFQIFGYLGIYTKKWIMAGTHYGEIISYFFRTRTLNAECSIRFEVTLVWTRTHHTQTNGVKSQFSFLFSFYTHRSLFVGQLLP
jgi:hypothetical protein